MLSRPTAGLGSSSSSSCDRTVARGESQIQISMVIKRGEQCRKPSKIHGKLLECLFSICLKNVSSVLEAAPHFFWSKHKASVRPQPSHLAAYRRIFTCCGCWRHEKAEYEVGNCGFPVLLLAHIV